MAAYPLNDHRNRRAEPDTARHHGTLAQVISTLVENALTHGAGAVVLTTTRRGLRAVGRADCPDPAGSDDELGALLVAAGLDSAQEHALISLPASNGLRINEALGADITAIGSQRGHRTLTVLRKGGKIVTATAGDQNGQRGCDLRGLP